MAKISVQYPDGDKASFANIATLADEYGALKEQRLAQDKVSAALKERESFLATYLIENLPKSDATGTAGKAWSVRITTKTAVSVTDWDSYYAFVFRTKRKDLMQRRVNDAAVKEMWEAGTTVPGVEPIQVPGVSLTKVKG